MSPRQQKAYEAIKACLLRETSWAAMRDEVEQGLVDDRPLNALRDAWEESADEAARTLVGVMDELQHEDAAEREAAVRELLAELAHGPERMDDQRPRVWWGNLQAAIGRVRRAFPVTR